MASQSEVQTLVTDARCLECLSEKDLMALQVYLIWIAQNPDGVMTHEVVAQLVEDSKCLAACASHKVLLAMEVELLSRV